MVTKRSCLASELMEWETSMRLMMSTASPRGWQVRWDEGLLWKFLLFFHYFIDSTQLNLSCLIQAEFSTLPLLRSSPFLRPSWHAPIRELNWPQLVSSTWPGRVGWTSVTPAGWETEASVTQSMFVGHSVEGVCWGCELFTSIQTRQDTHFLSPAMTPSATQVDSDKEERLVLLQSTNIYII